MNLLSNRRSTVVALGALVAAGVFADSQQVVADMPEITYSVTEIVSPVGDNANVQPNSINDNGEVGGAWNPTSVPPYVSYAFVWQGGVMKLLDSLGGTNPTNSGVMSINSRGEAVGLSAFPGSGCCPYHAVIWKDGEVIDLGTFGGDAAEAFGINNRAQVTGRILGGNAPGTSFFWYRGTHQFIGGTNGAVNTFGASSINDRGQVAGTLGTPTGAHAALWENGNIKDLGNALGGKSSVGNGINNRGQVVGWASTPAGSAHAFIWNDGVMNDLGISPNYASAVALAVNEADQVVGQVVLADGFTLHAALWDHGSLYDLNDLVSPEFRPLTVARSINNRGQILVHANTCDTCVLRGLLLTPHVGASNQ